MLQILEIYDINWISFYFQDGENGQIKIEHLSDQDVNQDQFQESNSDLILDRTRAEPRNNHNNANNTNTFEEKTVIRPLPQDIIVSIKDENSRSSTCSSHVFTNPETKAELLLLKPHPFICQRSFISKIVGNRRN